MQNKSLEIKVGIFVLVGLAIIGGLVITFGRMGEQIRSYYTLDVTFPNASGLLKGSNVYLSGAPIGRVTTPPKVVDNGNAVQVSVKLFDEIKISRKSRWVIGSSGLLGDRYVDVQLYNGNVEPYYEPGEKVEGARSTGLNDLADSTGPLVVDARDAIKQLKTALTNVNEDILTDETRADLKVSIVKVRSILTRVDSLMEQAQKGQGAIGMLLNNKEVADNLAAFIINIRRNGVLFYSDSATKEDISGKEKEKTERQNRDKRK